MALETAYLCLWFAGADNVMQNEQLLLLFQRVTAVISALKWTRRCSDLQLTSLLKLLHSHHWQFWCIWKTDSIWNHFVPSDLHFHHSAFYVDVDQSFGKKKTYSARWCFYLNKPSVLWVLVPRSLFSFFLSSIVWIFAFGSFKAANYKPTKACKQKSHEVTCGLLIGQLLGNLSSCQVRSLEDAAGGRGGWLCK